MNKQLLSIVITLSILAAGATAQDGKQQRLKAWLANQDPNGDGRIARDEASGLMKQYFDRNDANQDGFLDRQELQALAARLTRNSNRSRNRTYASDDQIQSRVPEDVEVELNIAYREGNQAWQLDLAKPKAASSAPRPAIVFVHGGGWTSGDKRAGNFLGPAIQYAQRGYVTVSVNYRLGHGILPCVQDAKCAVRNVVGLWAMKAGWSRLPDASIWNQRCVPEVAREFVSQPRRPTKSPDAFDRV